LGKNNSVILPQDFKNSILNDSKKLTDLQRKKLRPVIEECALSWAVGIVSAAEIDKINILQASFLAMHRAIAQLKIIPEHLLIDGNRFTQFGSIQHTTVIEGDGKYLNIAAASILAKTYRDDYMDKLHLKFPDYNWIKNKGYGTKQHRDAIMKFGVTKHHRKTFRLLAP
jgi:ribonuclease HII